MNVSVFAIVVAVAAIYNSTVVAVVADAPIVVFDFVVTDTVSYVFVVVIV